MVNVIIIVTAVLNDDAGHLKLNHGEWRDVDDDEGGRHEDSN